MRTDARTMRVVGVRCTLARRDDSEEKARKTKPKNAGGRLPAASKHRSERRAHFVVFLPAFLAVFLAAFFAVFLAAFFAAFFFAAIVGILC